MENIITNDAVVAAYPAPDFIRAAIAELEVYARAVTSGNARGRVCLHLGRANTQPLTPSLQGIGLRSGSGISFRGMDITSSIKPRPGSYAFSGTG